MNQRPPRVDLVNSFDLEADLETASRELLDSLRPGPVHLPGPRRRRRRPKSAEVVRRETDRKNLRRAERDIETTLSRIDLLRQQAEGRSPWHPLVDGLEPGEELRAARRQLRELLRRKDHWATKVASHPLI